MPDPMGAGYVFQRIAFDKQDIRQLARRDHARIEPQELRRNRRRRPRGVMPKRSYYSRTDIISDRYDAGVRRGRLIAQDMIAVPISSDIRMTVVGSPPYLAGRQRPKTPQDLIGHACINPRLPDHGAFFAWTFRKGGKGQRIKVEGQLCGKRVW